jgi:3-hydroxyacyl-CoA dehydrogenase
VVTQLTQAKSTATVTYADRLATITIDNPPVNIINAALRADLGAALTEIEAGTGLTGVLLLCAGSTFCSGADVGELSGPPRAAEYRALFNRIEALPIPVVAALHGTAMGGGLELALACHHRVAAIGARFGLPEVTLGIIPGAGGTQRMPRLIGIDATLDLVLDAEPLDAATGLKLGFIDAVLEGELTNAAREYLRGLVRSGKGPRRTGDLTVPAASVSDEILRNAASKAQQRYPNRIAPFTAIKAISASVRLEFARGLDYEAELINGARLTLESRAAVHVYFAERECRKLPASIAGSTPESAARAIKRAAIIGSGTMGGGIAICFANAGIPVTVVNVSNEALQRGLGVVEQTLDSMLKRGRINAGEMTSRLALISGSLDYADLRDADVIIEAAVEKMELKKQIFRQLDAIAKPGALLATNTSTLDIDELAAAVSRPGDVIGMHFFSPANVMRLLEVVRTGSTSASSINTAMELAGSLRKTPVLSRVCHGFIGNRMMEGYAREAERMVLEGATPRQIDSALEDWGMAMGILAVFDLAGIDVGVHIHRNNAALYPPDASYYQADFALFDAGRMGQKNGKGYYRYLPGDRSRYDDPEALAILRATAARLNVPQRQHSKEEIQQRCLYPLLNEGFKILEEGIAIRASDIDVVWTSGYGFPRYRGGPMFYAESLGLKNLLDGVLRYQSEFGPMHWQPARLLVELVASGGKLPA